MTPSEHSWRALVWISNLTPECAWAGDLSLSTSRDAALGENAHNGRITLQESLLAVRPTLIQKHENTKTKVIVSFADVFVFTRFIVNLNKTVNWISQITTPVHNPCIVRWKWFEDLWSRAIITSTKTQLCTFVLLQLHPCLSAGNSLQHIIFMRPVSTTDEYEFCETKNATQ
jgi:hypothetical protein